MSHHAITMGNDIARNIHCGITMSNVYAYHVITMHGDTAMSLFCDVPVFPLNCLKLYIKH